VEHSDAEIALHFRSDVELLISVMLSAQTTDVNVNRVTEKLFVKYRRPEDYLAVPQEELEQDVFQTGFYRQKAKSIRGAMRVLIEEFDGQVPGTIPELLRLPGVARKTANVVAALLAAGMFSWFFLSALYLQFVLGYSPLQVGLVEQPDGGVGLRERQLAHPALQAFIGDVVRDSGLIEQVGEQIGLREVGG